MNQLISRALLTASVILAPLITQVAQAQQSCESTFNEANGKVTKLGLLINEADAFFKGGEPSDAVKKAGLDFFMINPKDFANFFGSGEIWPVLLGVSKEGHIIAARPQDDRVRIESYKKLPISMQEYESRRRLDMAVQEGQKPPAGYESLADWIARTETDFDRVLEKFAKDHQVVYTTDDYQNRPTDAVQIRGSFGALTQPLLIRSTTLLQSTNGGRTYGNVSPETLTQLVNELVGPNSAATPWP